MASRPHNLQPFERRPPRRRVRRANLVMIFLVLLMNGALVALVLGHREPAALVAFGRLFSHRTWQVLEAVSFLFLFAVTAIARSKRAGD